MFIVLMAASTSAAQELSIVQTQSFNFATTGTFGGSSTFGPYIFAQYRPGYENTAAIFNGFDTSLGTLDAFRINWNLTVSGQSSDPFSQISASSELVYFGAELYGPTSSSGNGLSRTVTSDVTFQIGDPNSPFDASTLALLTAPSTPDFELTGSATISGIGNETFTASTVGGVTLTYYYTAAVPESGATCALMGAVALLAVGIVRSAPRTIERRC